VDIPPHLPNRRDDLPPLYFDSERDYLSAILVEAKQMIKKGRPTLILVNTVGDSLKISAQLKAASVRHQVLNAVQPEAEESIIAKAGMSGMLTVATNTAGRGTDIILSPDALDAGGLHVILGFYPINDRVGDPRFGKSCTSRSARVFAYYYLQ
jgi:preprotein translocase subunit SecA